MSNEKVHRLDFPKKESQYLRYFYNLVEGCKEIN